MDTNSLLVLIIFAGTLFGIPLFVLWLNWMTKHGGRDRHKPLKQ